MTQNIRTEDETTQPLSLAEYLSTLNRGGLHQRPPAPVKSLEKIVLFTFITAGTLLMSVAITVGVIVGIVSLFI